MSFKLKNTTAILGIAILFFIGLGLFSSAKKPPSFHALLDLCNRLDSLSPEQKHTMKVLLKKAKTKDCRQASHTQIA